jgi:hypothetical protein
MAARMAVTPAIQRHLLARKGVNSLSAEPVAQRVDAADGVSRGPEAGVGAAALVAGQRVHVARGAVGAHGAAQLGHMVNAVPVVEANWQA